MEVKVILLIAGIIMIIWGVLCQDSGFIERLIRWSNSLKGIKTEITKASILMGKITGIFFILFGVGSIIAFFLG